MSNVLIGIIGVIFFIGLAIAGYSYFGEAVLGSKVDAQATEYLNQQSQLARAIEHYSSDNGKIPVDGASDPVDILVSSKYLKSAPPGGRSPWTLNSDAKALLARPEGSVSEGLEVCIAARRKANMPDPEHPLQCDGSGGSLAKNDPCCLS